MKQIRAARLSRNDLRLALEFVHEHCAPDTVDRLISRAVEGLFRLFPCMVATYGEADPVRRTGSVVLYPTEFGSPETNERALSTGFQDLESTFKGYVGRAVRLSQIVSSARFRRTQMFQENFKPIGGQDLLVIKYDRSDGLLEFFSMFRQGKFSDRDEALLDAIAFPLQSALTNARALAYLYGHRSMLESGLSNSGWNTLIVNRSVDLVNHQARRLLGFHFGGLGSGIRCRDLSRWVEAARKRFRVVGTAPPEPALFCGGLWKIACSADAASIHPDAVAAARRR